MNKCHQPLVAYGTILKNKTYKRINNQVWQMDWNHTTPDRKLKLQFQKIESLCLKANRLTDTMKHTTQLSY